MNLQALAVRFWSNVLRGDACWLWAGAGRGDYGRMTIGSRSDGTRKVERATRVSWLVSYGPIPEDSHILHLCDNPGCVRPDHLFLGTPRDNMLDMHKKGRHPFGGALKGQKHHNAKLSASDVAEIREKYSKEKMSQKALGDQYGIGQKQISKIVRGLAWV